MRRLKDLGTTQAFWLVILQIERLIDFGVERARGRLVRRDDGAEVHVCVDVFLLQLPCQHVLHRLSIS